MAATVVSRSTGRTTTTNTTSHAITMPASLSAGNLLILIFSSDQVPTCTAPEDWNKLGQASNSTVVTGAIFWKFSNGSDTCTITTSTSEQSSHAVIQISGAGTPTGTSANGSSTNSNPPSHNSGETSTLWIATRSGDSTTVATAAPTNYGNLQSQAAAGTGGASTNTADRTTSATTENPGTFTSNTEQWVSWTIGIPDQPTDKAFVTGFGYDDVDNQTGKTFSVYIPFNNSTLIAGVNTYDGTDETLGRVSSITYNGNAMSLQQSRVDNDGADGGASYLYALTGLSAGTANLVITLAGNTDSPAFLWAVYANSASSIDASDLDTDASSGATVAGSITTVADKAMVFSFVDFNNVGGGNATGSDQQQIASINGGFTVISFSKTAQATAGAVTHTYTPSANDTGEVYTISIKPYTTSEVSITNTITGGTDSDGGNSSTTASVTLKANKLYLLTIAARRGDSVAPAITSVASTGATWVAVNSTDYDTGGTSRRGVFVYRTMVGSDQTGTIVITYTSNVSDATWVLDELSNTDTSGTNGSGAIVQSAVNQNTAGATSLTVTLGAFGSASNATFGAFANSDDAATNTAGTGFMNSGTGGNTTNGAKSFTEFRNDNDTSVDMSWSGAGSEVGGVAIEIKVASGATTSTSTTSTSSSTSTSTTSTSKSTSTSTTSTSTSTSTSTTSTSTSSSTSTTSTSTSITNSITTSTSTTSTSSSTSTTSTSSSTSISTSTSTTSTSSSTSTTSTSTSITNSITTSTSTTSTSSSTSTSTSTSTTSTSKSTSTSTTSTSRSTSSSTSTTSTSSSTSTSTTSTSTSKSTSTSTTSTSSSSSTSVTNSITTSTSFTSISTSSSTTQTIPYSFGIENIEQNRLVDEQRIITMSVERMEQHQLTKEDLPSMPSDE